MEYNPDICCCNSRIFGFGTIYGIKILPEAYMGNGLALLAPGAFIVLGLLIYSKKL